MSSPQARQYDSISVTQYGLAFRTDVVWPDDIFSFDAIFRGVTLELCAPQSERLASNNVAKCMGDKALSPFLVKSVAGKIVKRPTFRTNEVVPQSGIYRVRHKKHRLPHDVTLVRDQRFPRCAKCKDFVIFESLRPVQDETEVTTEFSTRIYLYELPVIEDEQEIAV